MENLEQMIEKYNTKMKTLKSKLKIVESGSEEKDGNTIFTLTMHERKFRNKKMIKEVYVIRFADEKRRLNYLHYFAD